MNYLKRDEHAPALKGAREMVREISGGMRSHLMKDGIEARPSDIIQGGAYLYDDRCGRRTAPHKVSTVDTSPKGNAARLGASSLARASGRSYRARSKKRKHHSHSLIPEEEHDPSSMVCLGPRIAEGSEALRWLHGDLHVRLSEQQKAAEILLHDDRFKASSRGGYRTVRGTHGAYKGCWYFEVKLQHMGATGAVRLGWSMRMSDTQAPVGTDEYSYAYRSKDGSRVWRGSRKAYGGSFGEGSVIGCLINLTEQSHLSEYNDDIVMYKGRYYYLKNKKSYATDVVLNGSYVEFFLDGVSQGRAFEELKDGCYYPAISLYSHPSQEEVVSVSVNFGYEDFQYPLPLDARPFSSVNSQPRTS